MVEGTAATEQFLIGASESVCSYAKATVE